DYTFGLRQYYPPMRSDLRYLGDLTVHTDIPGRGITVVNQGSTPGRVVFIVSNENPVKRISSEQVQAMIAAIHRGRPETLYRTLTKLAPLAGVHPQTIQYWLRTGLKPEKLTFLLDAIAEFGARYPRLTLSELERHYGVRTGNRRRGFIRDVATPLLGIHQYDGSVVLSYDHMDALR